MLERLKTGVIGAGVFAGYHASKIAASDVVEFTGVYDPDQSRAMSLANRFSGQAFADLDAVLGTSDAVIVASPASTHYDIGMRALDAGCHVLMEKPLALTGDRALALANLADANGLVLQVGHQERLVCQALGLFETEDRPRAIEIVRAGPPSPTGRAMDTSVLWDLMIHDIDLVHALLAGEVSDVKCEGHAERGPKLDKAIAQYTLNGAAVKLTASRIADARHRVMRLDYETGTIELDFISREIRNSTSLQVPSNLGDLVPDPLGAADEMFFKASLGQGAAMITGFEAARAVATAELLEKVASDT